MIFGVWPGVAGADLVDLQSLSSPPEDTGRTLAALRSLQGTATEFYVRAYRHFGPGTRPSCSGTAPAPAPARPGVYAGQGRLIDLVACYQSPVADPDGFAEFVRQAVRDVAAWGGGKMQVGEELNVPAPLDGGSPGCFEAVGAGVTAALDERDRHDVRVLVGVNSAGLPHPAFWTQLTSAIGPHNTSRLDYVGLDIFPDVFQPIARQNLAAAVTFLLRGFRAVTSEAGVPAATPIHVTETGWPTDDQRTEAAQADVLAAVADAVIASGAGVGAYEWFGLRDELSTAGWTGRFGLLRDDYSPKPAFAVVQDLITRHVGAGYYEA